MKKQVIVFLLIFLPFFLSANESNDNGITEYDTSGFTFEISCFNYFNAGVGYKWGNCKVMYGHFFASDYGFLLEYKTKLELHFRIFYDMYGGSAGILLGASAAAATDFKNVTFGIAPHIGAGFPGMKIFYRYNFYLDKKFNCHEFVLVISKGTSDENRKN